MCINVKMFVIYENSSCGHDLNRILYGAEHLLTQDPGDFFFFTKVKQILKQICS